MIHLKVSPSTATRPCLASFCSSSCLNLLFACLMWVTVLPWYILPIFRYFVLYGQLNLKGWLNWIDPVCLPVTVRPWLSLLSLICSHWATDRRTSCPFFTQRSLVFILSWTSLTFLFCSLTAFYSFRDLDLAFKHNVTLNNPVSGWWGLSSRAGYALWDYFLFATGSKSKRARNVYVVQCDSELKKFHFSLETRCSSLFSLQYTGMIPQETRVEVEYIAGLNCLTNVLISHQLMMSGTNRGSWPMSLKPPVTGKCPLDSGVVENSVYLSTVFH